MGLTHSPRIVTDGLVLCLDAASSRSYPGTGTTWTDLAGGNNATLTNGPVFGHEEGGIITTDGSDDSIDFPISSVLQPVNVTAGIWAKTDGTSSYKPIFCVDDGRYNDYGITIKDGGGGRYIGIQLNTNSGYINGSSSDSTYDLETDYGSLTDILTTQFNYILISYDGTTGKIFFNGEEKKSITSGIGGNIEYPNVLQIAIGSDHNTNFGASVASFHIYNRALTANEILQNYLATRGRFA